MNLNRHIIFRMKLMLLAPSDPHPPPTLKGTYRMDSFISSPEVFLGHMRNKLGPQTEQVRSSQQVRSGQQERHWGALLDHWVGCWRHMGWSAQRAVLRVRGRTTPQLPMMVNSSLVHTGWLASPPRYPGSPPKASTPIQGLAPGSALERNLSQDKGLTILSRCWWKHKPWLSECKSKQYNINRLKAIRPL